MIEALLRLRNLFWATPDSWFQESHDTPFHTDITLMIFQRISVLLLLFFQFVSSRCFFFNPSPSLWQLWSIWLQFNVLPIGAGAHCSAADARAADDLRNLHTEASPGALCQGHSASSHGRSGGIGGLFHLLWGHGVEPWAIAMVWGHWHVFSYIFSRVEACWTGKYGNLNCTMGVEVATWTLGPLTSGRETWQWKIICR